MRVKPPMSHERPTPNSPPLRLRAPALRRVAMLLHPLAAAALRQHAAEEHERARGWVVGLLHGDPAQCVVLSACRVAAECADLRADLGACAAVVPLGFPARSAEVTLVAASLETRCAARAAASRAAAPRRVRQR